MLGDHVFLLVFRMGIKSWQLTAVELQTFKIVKAWQEAIHLKKSRESCENIPNKLWLYCSKFRVKQIYTKFHWKKVQNNLMLALVSLFLKLLIKVVIYSQVYNSFYQKGTLSCIWVYHLHIPGYWGKIPFLMLHLHILISNSFYGLCR